MIGFWCNPCVDGLAAGLSQGVTDSGLSALAAAGCGAQLTSLTLSCEWCPGIVDLCVGVVALD